VKNIIDNEIDVMIWILVWVALLLYGHLLQYVKSPIGEKYGGIIFETFAAPHQRFCWFDYRVSPSSFLSIYCYRNLSLNEALFGPWFMCQLYYNLL